MEHGWQGRYIEGFELAQQYGLKFVSGVEAYWVKDRFEKDRSNCHIYIGAKNERGRRAMNDVMAEANITGFYIRPRLDIPLLLSLPADDVIVTTACVAYWKYEDIDDITLRLRDHFRENFFLEVQYHNMDKQIAVNEHVLDLRAKHNIPIIMGCDSHYLSPSDAGERSDYIVSKGIEYPDEQGFVLDYPDGDEAYRRFANQGVLSHSDIIEAMENTNVFLKVEDYDCACFTKDIKMPSLHPDWTQDQKDAAYDNLIWSAWSKEKENIPSDKWPHYESEIQKEVDIVHQTFHADYFLDDHAIVKKGKENGGVLTKTGRGCWVAGCLVNTTDNIKPIENVVPGDIVFDKDGEQRVVLNTAKYHIKEELIKISYPYSFGKYHQSICTKDHKIYVHRNGENQWVVASDLTTDDYLISPKIHLPDDGPTTIDLAAYCSNRDVIDAEYIYEYNAYTNGFPLCPKEVSSKIGCGKSIIEKIANGYRPTSKKAKWILDAFFKNTPFKSLDQYQEYVFLNRTKKIRRFININQTFMTFIGLMYGDGSVKPIGGGVDLAINSSNHKAIANKKIFCKIASMIGVDVSEVKAKNRDLTTLTFYSLLFARFVREELFESKKGREKLFNPRWLNCSKENKIALLKGLLLSDGSLKDDGRIAFDNTSLSIINAMYLLVRATTNYPCSISHRPAHTDERGYVCKDSYKLRIYYRSDKTAKRNERTIFDDHYVYIPIKSIDVMQTQECDVYDIEVDGSHSFVLNGIAVHNSAVSFYTNKLLGLTDVDRIAAKVKMYPERFMSATRILETGSIADIDLNVADRDPFLRAQKEIMGEESSYEMIAYGTLKPKAAWKMYAKSQNVDFIVANEVSDQISKYENAVKHASEDEKDDINVMDYIDPAYHEIFEQSRNYRGIVSHLTPHPCATLLYQGNIRQEIGLINIKGKICCIMDGLWAEQYHFLKNDQLVVYSGNAVDYDALNCWDPLKPWCA